MTHILLLLLLVDDLHYTFMQYNLDIMTTMIDGDEFIQYKNVNMNIKC